jgi:hypothetical protein
VPPVPVYVHAYRGGRFEEIWLGEADSSCVHGPLRACLCLPWAGDRSRRVDEEGVRVAVYGYQHGKYRLLQDYARRVPEQDKEAPLARSLRESQESGYWPRSEPVRSPPRWGEGGHSQGSEGGLFRWLPRSGEGLGAREADLIMRPLAPLARESQGIGKKRVKLSPQRESGYQLVAAYGNLIEPSES